LVLSNHLALLYIYLEKLSLESIDIIKIIELSLIVRRPAMAYLFREKQKPRAEASHRHTTPDLKRFQKQFWPNPGSRHARHMVHSHTACLDHPLCFIEEFKPSAMPSYAVRTHSPNQKAILCLHGLSPDSLEPSLALLQERKIMRNSIMPPFIKMAG
jgi:hypothetical protein